MALFILCQTWALESLSKLGVPFPGPVSLGAPHSRSTQMSCQFLRVLPGNRGWITTIFEVHIPPGPVLGNFSFLIHFPQRNLTLFFALNILQKLGSLYKIKTKKTSSLTSSIYFLSGTTNSFWDEESKIISINFHTLLHKMTHLALWVDLLPTYNSVNSCIGLLKNISSMSYIDFPNVYYKIIFLIIFVNITTHVIRKIFRQYEAVKPIMTSTSFSKF